MGLELYKLPLGLTKGIDIPLPQTEVVFRVMLPSNSNEEFNMKMMAEMNASQSFSLNDEAESPEIKVDAAMFMKTRRNLFFKTCIISAEGLPEGMTIDEFLDEYDLAKRYIFNRANELATEADSQVTEAMEKLLPTQNGKSFGQVGKRNTKSSKGMASQ